MPTVPGTATVQQQSNGLSVNLMYLITVFTVQTYTRIIQKKMYISNRRPAGRHHRSNSSPIRFSSITHPRAAHNACHYSMTSRFGVCMLMALRRRRRRRRFRRRQTARRRNGALGAGAFAQSQFPSHCQQRYLCYLSAGVPVVSCAVPPLIPSSHTHDYQHTKKIPHAKKYNSHFWTHNRKMLNTLLGKCAHHLFVRVCV